jgi:N,N'-diacetyllegionaminate synthase
MKIGRWDSEHSVLMIAEIGNNHEGQFDTAKRLVEEAAKAGVDAVKFQTFATERFVRKTDIARFQQLKKYELSPEEFAKLAHLARSLNLLFFSTPLDIESVYVLAPLVDAYKIASGDNNFYPMIDKIAESDKPIILSTGASDLAQVQRSVQFIRDKWNERGFQGMLGVLHCVSSYPVPPENANLRSIPFLMDKLDETIGYSDHTLGDEAAVLAIASGARIIEKHFTLDRDYSDFRDHKLSADPAMMRRLVDRVRTAETLLGTYSKHVQPCEQALLPVIRRSITAAVDLPAGHKIKVADLMWVRPSGGLSPGEESVLLGKVLKRAVKSGEALSASDAS